jgi:signal transduction histidine kinase
VRGGIRGRLLVAFVLVAVPPLLLLAALVTVRAAGRFERDAAERLAHSLQNAAQRIEDLELQAEVGVEAVAGDLPGAYGSVPDHRLAGELAADHRLEALEIIGADGKVLSSHHWPAGFDFADEDGLFGDASPFRLERVASGYGEARRLAVLRSKSLDDWRGTRLTIRAGAFVDGRFLDDLSASMAVQVGLYDGVRSRWSVASRSPLGAWRDPPFARAVEGRVAIAGPSYGWRARALADGLWLVVAVPRSAVEGLQQDVTGAALAITGASLLAALVAAFVLSTRIARPVRELADGVRRVSSGDLGSSVAAAAGGEIGELARAFNAMTAELRVSRERLLQAERVAAWREMARRLAHELKNPLFPIQLSIETLRRAFDQRAAGSPATPGGADRFDGLFRESCDTILDELRSLRAIVDEFSAFARMPQPQLRATDLNAVVEQVIALYQPRLAAVAVEKSLAADLPAVSADRDLLARALGNLVANALDAMPQDGTLRLRTAARPDAVAVEVEDTGPGLTDDQRTRLFTPYYTTKKGGTGLGLAIVQSIVSDHGGRIEVRSEPGRGTAFTLVLPHL